LRKEYGAEAIAAGAETKLRKHLNIRLKNQSGAKTCKFSRRF
jgi:hypothetical protein